MEQVQVLFERKMHEFLTPRNSTIGERLCLRKKGYKLARISESVSPRSSNSIEEKICNLVTGYINEFLLTIINKL